MNGREFQALLDEQRDLAAAHADLCAEINECHLSESSLEAKWRDAAYAKLQVVTEKIEAVIVDERTSELERA